MVALGGYILMPILFSIFGIGTQEILGETRYVFILLVGEATVALLLIFWFLRIRRQSGREIGWNWSGFGKETRVGFLMVPLLFATVSLTGLLFQYLLPQYVSTTNPIFELIQTHEDLILLLISSIYVGGIKEEVQRAFILVRFERYLGGAHIGLLCWSLAFGWGHVIQGVDSAVGAGLLGLWWGLLFLWRRKLTAPILSHALFDIITLTIFWNFLRHAGSF